MRNLARLALSVAAVAALSAMPAAAQTGSINATATVLQALSVNGTDLAFGNIAPTATKTVAPAAGGTFVVAGQAGANVNLTFTLPTSLGTGVAIGSWTGLQNTANASGTATAFTPSGTTFATPLSGTTGTGNLYIWLGATLTTTAAATGSYSAPIQLTVSYN